MEKGLDLCASRRMLPRRRADYVLRRTARLGLPFLLMSCDLAAPPAQPPVEIPPAVQAVMDAEFPADGKVHSQSLGKITITPDTIVCAVWKAAPEQARAGHLFGINSDDLFVPLGQSPGWRDGDRQRSAIDPICERPGSVFIYGRKTENRKGKPYRLVLTIWQGDPANRGSLWFGGIERFDGLRRDIEVPAESEAIFTDHDRTDRTRTESLAADIRDLAAAFISHVESED